MGRRDLTYTAVRAAGRPGGRSHIVETRGSYHGSVFGMFGSGTLCGAPAGDKIPLLPAAKASCSDCRNIYKIKIGKDQ